MTEEIAAVRTNLASGLRKLRDEMIKNDNAIPGEVQKSKADTIKWMFILWVGQIGVLLGIIFAVLK